MGGGYTVKIKTGLLFVEIQLGYPLMWARSDTVQFWMKNCWAISQHRLVASSMRPAMTHPCVLCVCLSWTRTHTRKHRQMRSFPNDNPFSSLLSAHFHLEIPVCLLQSTVHFSITHSFPLPCFLSLSAFFLSRPVLLSLTVS